VGDYLTNNPQLFSEFTRMLDTTGVMGLLKAYGKYTVFAPTNEAIKRYYSTLEDEEGKHTITSLNQLTLKDIKEFCYNHIIKGDTLRTKDFTEGALGSRSMSERFYTVSFSDSAIIINGSSPIVARDITLHNGIVHVLGEVLSPAYGNIAEVFEKDSARFGIYVKALKATGLYMIMNKARNEDEGYDYTAGVHYAYLDNLLDHFTIEKPTSRKFGFTILAVSDADLANYVTPGSPNGVHSLADLEKLAKYYYSRELNNDADAITDKTDPKNYLNRFMSYHCFDRILLSSRFVKDLFTPNQFPEYPMPEYIETMMENTIVEVLMDKQGKIIGPTMAADPKSAFGVFNYDDPMQGAVLTDFKDLPPSGSLNGYYHGITKPIFYSKTLEKALASKRLRIDAATFLPELTTNNLRGNNPTGKMLNGRMPCLAIDDKYVDNYTGSSNTQLFYVEASKAMENYQGDNFIIKGPYNFTLKTCPIPAGTYEVRIASLISAGTGIAQLYLDSLPCGIPIDLTTSTYLEIGYEVPGTDKQDPEGYENDKILHNHGYMKGPNTYTSDGTIWVGAASARMSGRCLRKVLGTYTFNKTENHYFTAICLSSTPTPDGFNVIWLDYLEFCPVSVLDKEGIE